MSSYLTYEVGFLIYLVIQSLAINGIYISAAGKTETLPDGSKVDSEMILYPLYKYLNQSYNQKIYYSLAEINKKTMVIPTIAGGFIQWVGSGYYFTIAPTSGELNLAALEAWADAYLKAEVEYDAEHRTVAIFQREPRYKFSKYLRKPIITCVICMASFWCIFLFLIPVICLFGWSIKIIPIWVVNTFCVSYLNYVIFKPRR